MLRFKVENIIKSHQLSVTKIRKKVLRVFLKSLKPLTLQDIRLLVGSIDRITLFRILSTFEDKGIIHKIRLEHGDVLYALCQETCQAGKHNHKHIHFKCESCDTVSCLTIDNFPIFSIPNYQFNNVNINVSGFCQLCIV